MINESSGILQTKMDSGSINIINRMIPPRVTWSRISSNTNTVISVLNNRQKCASVRQERPILVKYEQHLLRAVKNQQAAQTTSTSKRAHTIVPVVTTNNNCSRCENNRAGVDRWHIGPVAHHTIMRFKQLKMVPDLRCGNNEIADVFLFTSKHHLGQY